MIFTTENLLKVIEDKIEYEADSYDKIRIEDVDDLNDFILDIRIGDSTIEEYDYLYYQAVSLLPQVIDDVIDILNDIYDDVIGEQWRVYYSMIAF